MYGGIEAATQPLDSHQADGRIRAIELNEGQASCEGLAYLSIFLLGERCTQKFARLFVEVMDDLLYRRQTPLGLFTGEAQPGDGAAQGTAQLIIDNDLFELVLGNHRGLLTADDIGKGQPGSSRFGDHQALIQSADIQVALKQSFQGRQATRVIEPLELRDRLGLFAEAALFEQIDCTRECILRRLSCR
jgi:hypothetical protein